MHFTVNVHDLNEGLSIVTRALAARSANPILEGVLIEFDGGELTLTCSDGNLTIQTVMEADAPETGRMVLPGRLFAEVVRRLPGSTVRVDAGDKYSARVSCLSYRSTLSGMNPVEYPQIAEPAGGVPVVMEQRVLRRMISGVQFAIAADESRQILTGCLLEVSSEEARMVALDGFRLAMQRDCRPYPLPEGTDTIKAIIPGRVVGELAKLLPDAEDACSMNLDGGHMTVSFGKTRLSSVLLRGDYIDYRRILPPTFAVTAKTDRAALLNAVERAGLIAREGKNNLIRLSFREDTVQIAANAEIATGTEELPVALTGDRLDIAFNARYLIDVLHCIDDEEVQIEFNSNVSPCVFVPVEGKDFIYLILPVRVFQ